MADWATSHIEKLKAGALTVEFRPKGNSMVPLIHSGDKVEVTSLITSDIVGHNLGFDDLLEKGDIVLCKVNGKHYLHKVMAITSESVLIGNNRGKMNGWTSHVYGKVTKVSN